MIHFESIADGVYLARTQPLDVSVSLVIGDETALVIDTLSTAYQASELVAAIRAVTSLPLTIVNTHSHFDHTFGNAVVAAGGRPIWAHENAITALDASGPQWQQEWANTFRERDPQFAAGLADTKIQNATHPVHPPQRLDLGGRTVTIDHHGRGHTDGDLVVRVDDADVLFVGDLIEQSGPPAFGEDSYPLEWPEAVAALLHSPARVIVPGHGTPVDIDFVAAAHAQLSEFAWLIRHGHRDGGTPDEVAARAPWPADACRIGVLRGFAALDQPS